MRTNEVKAVALEDIECDAAVSLEDLSMSRDNYDEYIEDEKNDNQSEFAYTEVPYVDWVKSQFYCEFGFSHKEAILSDDQANRLIKASDNGWIIKAGEEYIRYDWIDSNGEDSEIKCLPIVDEICIEFELYGE